jgi:heme o synthase
LTRLAFALVNEGALGRRVFAKSVAIRIARVGDFLALTKPRVMSLVLFTAAVGLVAAPAHVDPLVGFGVILCIAMGAGAAGALNMWYDADVDRLMSRTAARPIPRGRVLPGEALAFGLTTGSLSAVALGFLTNLAAAGLLAFTIFFYIAVYTAWLKRLTPHSIVIGGAAGAAPPVIAWIAATGQVGLEPLILFLIVFFWTPPHFWALSLNRTSEYRRAGIPALPIVSGEQETLRQIFIYALLLTPISLLPWLLSFATAFYALVAAVSGAVMLALACRLRHRGEARRQAANRLFAFSICYLVLLFGALLVEKIVVQKQPPGSCASRAIDKPRGAAICLRGHDVSACEP